MNMGDNGVGGNGLVPANGDMAIAASSGPAAVVKGRQTAARTWSALEGKDLLKACGELKLSDDTPLGDARWDLLAEKMMQKNPRWTRREKAPNRDHFVQSISTVRSVSSSFSMTFTSNPLYKDKLMPAMTNKDGDVVDITSPDFVEALKNHVKELFDYLTAKANDKESRITKSWWDEEVLYDYVSFSRNLNKYFISGCCSCSNFRFLLFCSSVSFSKTACAAISKFWCAARHAIAVANAAIAFNTFSLSIIRFFVKHLLHTNRIFEYKTNNLNLCLEG